jgi:hypothetical protein
MEKVVEKMGVFIFLCWETAKNTLYQNAEQLRESVLLCFLRFTRVGILILGNHHVRTSVAVRTQANTMPSYTSVAV